jgi:N-acetylgalactosamine-N,N'-diacetylbacillosaminyl-diphospho-undecaprenol 4-alpha-N-acetylgalactosaminyltransferase
LLLIGYGDNLSAIKKQIAILNINEQVTIVENITNPYPYLISASAFVLSSNFEGFPNVILEALQARLPIISTDCKSGPREILSPNTDINKTVINDIELGQYGILTPTKNTDLLTKAMEILYADKKLYTEYEKKSQERIEAFSANTIYRQYIQLIFSS